ncbi:hypothetical protein [Stackebrandtia nassauensis]|uniref:Uncharacterized protein n=1 Tax=Stackebrandtia nassauensis (strain DSM 44728 / CIP 108903 / NRRL B-16338 / NBRC 102104 / LLR-40K-21) TaxID=446470 RepID=D3PZZ2_STANL|nr:hypothetical protein [Stackebrandtia nassauensis]ADD43679.1 hypothetical protein Snas_4027 [Stackebrandtia nassauensis DSM 44728]
MELFPRKRFIRWASVIAALAGITAVLVVVVTGDSNPSPLDEVSTSPPLNAEVVSSLGVKPPTGECEIAELPGDGKDATGLKISPDGENVVGELTDEDYDSQTVLWRDGDRETLSAETLQNGDVNSNGAVVGDFVSDGGETSWLYVGKKTTVNYPGAEFVRLVDVNDSGEVVGNAITYGKRVTTTEEYVTPQLPTPLLWKAGSSTPVELQVREGMRGTVTAITDGGMALGYQYRPSKDQEDSGGVGEPWLWRSDGKGWKLPEPVTNALPIDVAGDWVLSGGVEIPHLRWRLSDPGRMQRLSPDLMPKAIDDEGRVYGVSHPGDWPIPTRQDDGDELVKLPTLDAPKGLDHGLVQDASRDGSVLTGESLPRPGGDMGQPTSAVTWTCGT